MDWIAIIEALLKFLAENCLERQSNDRLFRVLRRAGPRVANGVRQVLLSQGVPRGNALREATARVLEDLRDASDEEIRRFIDDAQAQK
jgi:hypothetical protein